MLLQKVRGMKFLIILRDKYPQFRPDIAVLFGRELAERGHEIHWRMQSEGQLDKRLKTMWGGGPVIVAPRTGKLRWHHRILNNLRDLANDLAGLFVRGGFDVVQVKDKFFVALLGPFAARRNQGCFVYWLSYPFPEAWKLEAKKGTALYPAIYGLRGKLCTWLLYRMILPRADHIMVQSEQMRRDIAANGIDLDKMTPVPMGVDMADFPKPGPSQENNNVLYLGTMIRVRGLEFLLRVFKIVLAKRPEARLIMIGAGKVPDDLELLKQEAAKLGIAGQVEFTGFMDRALAMERVKEAAVCVSPFKPSPILNSTSPTKLSEYLAMGKPVVANDHPEQSLVLGESGGGVVTAWDEAEFAQGILDLLALSPAKRDEMGQRGRRWVEQHRSYSAIADMVEQVYLDICKREQR